MYLKFIILFSVIIYSSEGFSFKVSRLLHSTSVIDSDLWSDVEVTGNCEKTINLKIQIPKKAAAKITEVSIFFANNVKNILQIDMKEKIQGTVYKTPFNSIGNKEADDTEKTVTETHHTIKGSFPGSWLPVNSSKISATIETDEKIYYNYYGIQNYAISILDLMVVEEYKDFKCSLLQNS